MSKNIINIYSTKIEQPWPQKVFDSYMSMIPERLQKAVLKEDSWEKQHGSLARKILLWYGLDQMKTDMRDLFESIQYEASGKPYIVDAPNFSLANDESIAVCALSSESVLGIDIERMKPINLSEFRDDLTYLEWREIYSHVIPLQRFYEMWTIKQSVLKADKFMKNFNAKEIFVDPDVAFCHGQNWYIHQVDTEYYGYVCRMVCSMPHADVNYIEVDLQEVVPV